ncbi:MAG TPA: hypothetical protein VER33_17260 [Polyangiaceae bacterium]|nr:hypothetical protein [Polyangiaceae bacterium]
MATERPPESDEPDREQRRLERLIPELIKRLLEAGYEKLSEGPENVRQRVADLKLPKEALGVLLAQLDETKSGLYRAVAREVRDVLEHTNFSEELAKVLTTLSFEIKTEVRFIPNDQRLRASPEVKTRVNVRRDRGSQPPTPTPSPPGAAQDPSNEAKNSQSEEKSE